MLRLQSLINIAGKEFDFITDIQISSSWERLTDTAVLTFPPKILQDEKNITVGEDIFVKRGDPIRIQLGYFPNLVTRFEGYVSRVIPGTPLVIECEDAAWLLKQQTLTFTKSEITLADMMDFVISEAVDKSEGDLKENLENLTIEVVADAKFNEFTLTRATPAQFLEALKREYGLYSYARDNTLYVGLAYVPENAAQVSFSVDDPNSGAVIESNLEYRREDDVKIKVTGISIQEDNSKIIIEKGDPDGAQKTLNFQYLDKDEVEAAVDRMLPLLKYEGFYGDFMTFGQPAVNHGDNVTLTDSKITEKTGTYLVDSVDIEFGVNNGYKQRIALGAIIAQ